MFLMYYCQCRQLQNIYLTTIFQVTNSKCVTVGLGFNEQIVEDLPVSDTDFKLSQVIYPSICNVEIPTKLPPVPEPFSI